jgi:hypothetical protein
MLTGEGPLTLEHPAQDAETLANFVREGRFQRSLSLLTAATSVLSGLEVAYEHYRGSYSRRVMYTCHSQRSTGGCRGRGLLQPACRA